MHCFSSVPWTDLHVISLAQSTLRTPRAGTNQIVSRGKEGIRSRHLVRGATLASFPASHPRSTGHGAQTGRVSLVCLLLLPCSEELGLEVEVSANRISLAQLQHDKSLLLFPEQTVSAQMCRGEALPLASEDHLCSSGPYPSLRKALLLPGLPPAQQGQAAGKAGNGQWGLSRSAGRLRHHSC